MPVEMKEDEEKKQQQAEEDARKEQQQVRGFECREVTRPFERLGSRSSNTAPRRN